jgi:hypothetical protein
MHSSCKFSTRGGFTFSGKIKIPGSKFKGHGSRFKIQNSRLKITPNTQSYAFYKFGKGACKYIASHKYRRYPFHHKSWCEFASGGKRDYKLGTRKGVNIPPPLAGFDELTLPSGNRTPTISFTARRWSIFILVGD